MITTIIARTAAPIQASPEKLNFQSILVYPLPGLSEDDVQSVDNPSEEGEYYPEKEVDPEVFGNLAFVHINSQGRDENRENDL
jgi:hypothetical protein